MQLYDVTPKDGETVPVFAASFDDAANIYTAWHLWHQSPPMSDLEVKQRNPRWSGLNVEHLGVALGSGIAGMGQYDPDSGWNIVSPASDGDEIE